MMRNFSLTLLTTLTLTTISHSETRIIDGDTLTHNGERIRIWGLDCAEIHTHAGLLARAQARILIEGNIIRLDRKSKDKFGRTVAIVHVQRTSRAEFFTFDFACAMIQGGWCTEYTKFSLGYYERCRP